MAEKIPDHLEPYIRILGEDLAIQLFLTLGGGPTYFAHNPQPEADLSLCIGVEMVQALAKEFGARHIPRVPIPREWIANRLAERGWKVVHIARELHVSDVTVRKWLKPKEDRQLSFFSKLG